jgi:ribosomal subunit interface protein
MATSVQVSFRHLDYSPFIATAVRKKAARLQKFYPRITSLRVMIEPSMRRRQQGDLFHIRIDMTVPGKEIVVKRDPSAHHAHEDVYVAIRDAFDAARRQLEDYVRINFRGRQRQRVGPMHARVIRVIPNEECGFLQAEDGREIYFHKNSVLNGDFDRLEPGAEVRFAEEEGEEGPQASSVARIGKEGRHRKAA